MAKQHNHKPSNQSIAQLSISIPTELCDLLSPIFLSNDCTCVLNAAEVSGTDGSDCNVSVKGGKLFKEGTEKPIKISNE